MFYCAPCATKNGWPDYGARASYGKCEVCGKTAGCNDVPSKYLPIPKWRIDEATAKAAPEPVKNQEVKDVLRFQYGDG